jgi:hypothetical protein
MKNVIAMVLVCSLLAPAVMTAAAPARSPLGLTRIATRPKFRIQSVAQLKMEKFNLTPVAAGALAGLGPQIAGNPAYKTNNGVLLSVSQPISSNPNAVLLVQNVEWGQNIYAQFVSDNSDPILVQYRPAQEQCYLATALFRDLPSAQHTYLLTIGTTADVTGLKVELLRGAYVMPEYTPSFTNVVQTIESDKLIANAGLNEVRALFTYAAGSEPLSVRWYWGPSGSTRINFHHMQLVQLD